MMEIRIYQINIDKDSKRLAFRDLERMKEIQHSAVPDVSIYDKVFDGPVDCKNLEEVFGIFNCNHPEGYMGRSLSVSDIVEIVTAPDMEPGFYFCDNVGFTKVEFKPTSKINVVVLEPGKMARTESIENSFDAMRKLIGNDIMSCSSFDAAKNVCVVCNKQTLKLPFSRILRKKDYLEQTTYPQMKEAFYELEKSDTDKHRMGMIVVSEDSFDKQYPEEARTYLFSSDNKAFKPNMCGYSIFGCSLDGSETGVRLDAYLEDERGGSRNGKWKIERCYFINNAAIPCDIDTMQDMLRGTWLIAGWSENKPQSLSEEQLQKYKMKFYFPEHLVPAGSGYESKIFDPYCNFSELN